MFILGPVIDLKNLMNRFVGHIKEESAAQELPWSSMARRVRRVRKHNGNGSSCPKIENFMP